MLCLRGKGVTQMKKKWKEEDPDPYKDPEQPSPAISMEKFAATLHKQALAGDFYYSARISAQGLAGDVNEISKSITACVWEATGFRFTYGWFPLEGESLIIPLFN
jgi:hypothetical protein